MEKPIAVISMVRNDSFFANKWISYYGAQFGYQNLYSVSYTHLKLPTKRIV